MTLSILRTKTFDMEFTLYDSTYLCVYPRDDVFEQYSLLSKSDSND